MVNKQRSKKQRKATTANKVRLCRATLFKRGVIAKHFLAISNTISVSYLLWINVSRNTTSKHLNAHYNYYLTGKRNGFKFETSVAGCCMSKSSVTNFQNLLGFDHGNRFWDPVAYFLATLFADALQHGASQFEQQAGKLKRKFWLQNLKVKRSVCLSVVLNDLVFQMMIIMGVIGLVILIIIVSK